MELKKLGFISVLIIVIFAVFIFVNKLFYPSLPIANLSAKEVIERLEESDDNIVKIAEKEAATWYITKTKNEGISIADENIKQMIESSGWDFKEKDGAGLFFEKEGDRLVATTQMWTKKYVLVKIQNQ